LRKKDNSLELKIMQLTERLSSFERGSEYNAHKNQNTVDLQKEIENLRREVTKQ